MSTGWTDPPAGYSSPADAYRDGNADQSMVGTRGWICQRCSAVVASAATHDQYHQELTDWAATISDSLQRQRRP